MTPTGNASEELIEAADVVEGDKHPSKVITVAVNLKPVTVPNKDVSGLQIKQAAIDAGLPIDLGFQLLHDKKNGHDEEVPDTKVIEVNKHSVFTAIAPDDNS